VVYVCGCLLTLRRNPIMIVSPLKQNNTVSELIHLKSARSPVVCTNNGEGDVLAGRHTLNIGYVEKTILSMSFA
jgi:hypothetical protein